LRGREVAAVHSGSCRTMAIEVNSLAAKTYQGVEAKPNRKGSTMECTSGSVIAPTLVVVSLARGACRCPLISCASETKDWEKDKRQQKQADPKADAFTEAFSYVDVQNNYEDQVDERDE
jgi:hypothetical protein